MLAASTDAGARIKLRKIPKPREREGERESWDSIKFRAN